MELYSGVMAVVATCDVVDLEKVAILSTATGMSTTSLAERVEACQGTARAKKLWT